MLKLTASLKRMMLFHITSSQLKSGGWILSLQIFQYEFFFIADLGTEHT